MAANYDLVVRNGTVFDGTGGDPFEADVAVIDGRFAAIGRNLAAGREEIDAKGKLVTPGFVDLHTHFDGQAVWDSRLAPTSWHGVTTVLMGNCGVGFAPVRERDRDQLIELMEGVEDIPNPCLHEGLDWKWSSYGEYLDRVASRPHDVDICSLLPHAALRVYVMGERALRLEPATAEDSAQMKVLARAAVRAGALGFSTSRTISHKTKKGDLTPTYRAEEHELVSIAEGIAEEGRRLIQFISDWDTPDPRTEFAMLRRAVENSGCPALVSVNQRHDRPHVWRELMQMCRDAVDDGLSMRPVIAPRTIGIVFSLQGTQNPFSGTPSYRAIADKPLAERVAIMRDPEFRKKLLSEDRFKLSTFAVLARTSYERMFAFDEVDYSPPREMSVAAIARREGRSPDEVAYDMLLRKDGRQLLFTPAVNYHDYNLDACRDMIADPNALIGLSDGGAHVGFITDASFTTYLLSYWARDRKEFSLSELVRRHTLDNARAIGLGDRGTIEIGMKGDLNVIDLDRLGIEFPYMVNDLPAGGLRLLQKARGYDATVVSGLPTYLGGEATANLPGRLVRGPQGKPN